MTALAEPLCPRCHAPHAWEACPHVKAIEYRDFEVSRIEFLVPADYGRPTVPAPAPAEPEDAYPKLGKK